VGGGEREKDKRERERGREREREERKRRNTSKHQHLHSKATNPESPTLTAYEPCKDTISNVVALRVRVSSYALSGGHWLHSTITFFPLKYTQQQQSNLMIPISLPKTLNLSAPTTTSLSSAEKSNFPETVLTSNFLP
jgi:hypothetical protein